MGWTALQRATVIQERGKITRLVVGVTYLFPSDSDSRILASIRSSLDTLRPQSEYRGTAPAGELSGPVATPSVLDFLGFFVDRGKLLAKEP